MQVGATIPASPNRTQTRKLLHRSTGRPPRTTPGIIATRRLAATGGREQKTTGGRARTCLASRSSAAARFAARTCSSFSIAESITTGGAASVAIMLQRGAPASCANGGKKMLF